MENRYNIFISWSGTRSRRSAQILHDWLPLVLQSSRPWMSEEDIDKGSRGLDEIGRALEGIRIGIICLTPENLAAPWILYEAGALSKTLDAKTRLCTYLLGGLRPQDVERPLGMFQASTASKEDTRKLVDSINRSLDGDPVPKENLDILFESMWSLLEQKLEGIPDPSQDVKAKRTVEDMVGEILDLIRAEANRRKGSEWVDQYLPQLRETLPFLTNILNLARNQWTHAGVTPGVGPSPLTSRKVFHLKLKTGETKSYEGILMAQVGGGVVIIYDMLGNPIARVENVESFSIERLDDKSPSQPSMGSPRPGGET